MTEPRESLIGLIRSAAPEPEQLIGLVLEVIDTYSPDEREAFLRGLRDAEGGYAQFVETSAEPDGGWRSEREYRLVSKLERFGVGQPPLIRSESIVQDARLRKLADTGRVLRLPHGDQDDYPTFQFTLTDGRIYVPARDVQAANRLLRARRDPWGALGWWLAPNAWISDQAPADLIGSAESESVLPDLAASLAVVPG